MRKTEMCVSFLVCLQKKKKRKKVLSYSSSVAYVHLKDHCTYPLISPIAPVPPSPLLPPPTHTHTENRKQLPPETNCKASEACMCIIEEHFKEFVHAPPLWPTHFGVRMAKPLWSEDHHETEEPASPRNKTWV